MSSLALILAAAMCSLANSADLGFPLHVQATQLLRRAPEGPLGVVRLTLALETRSPLAIRVVSADGSVLLDETLHDPQVGQTWEIGVPAPPDDRPTMLQMFADDAGVKHAKTVNYTYPDDNWVLHFIPGFHYDPVWWNTQAHYTETGYRMADAVGPGLTLVAEYLRKCFEDPDYTVALHQLPYLKTFIEAHPQRFAELRSRIAEKRCAIVGGTYNELSTTLISAEVTARNAIYGTLFQRDVLGGDGNVWWQCDVFGHDPSFPSMMRAAGHRAGAFARGPFHQWGAPREQVNFPSEFHWMAPDGESVLTHYMTGHYGYAYEKLATGANRAADDPLRWEQLLREMFADLRRPALTHHVLLPMHMDFIRPLENLGAVVRHWNEVYASPQARMSTPSAFFAGVETEIAARQLAVPIITRDMNPVYTGCAVSFADLKTAQRDCEVTLREAEIFATLALDSGMPYPSLELDRAWRQLLFNAHHDAVTGSMSDQVYLDIMYAYRDCLELARGVRRRALDHLNAALCAGAQPGERIIWNSLSAARSAGPLSTDPDAVVPSVGFLRVRQVGDPGADPTVDRAAHALENEHLRATIDPANGTIVSLRLRKDRRELLRGPANDLVVLDEYDVLPGHGEGPWHLSPTGKRLEGASLKATVLAPDPRRPHALRYRVKYPQFTRDIVYELLPGSPTLDMETTVHDWRGSNQLLRVEFPMRLPGTRPVYQTAAAVIGRPFARDVDTAEDAWTLDQTCWQWAGLGSVARLEVRDGNHLAHSRALGVAEIIIHDGAGRMTTENAGNLAKALVMCGVTSTMTRNSARRYGDLEYDSNWPDFRIVLGAIPATLKAAGIDAPVGSSSFAPINRSTLSWWESDSDLPVLIVPNSQALLVAIAELNARHTVTVQRRNATLLLSALVDDYGAALINHGSVSMHITPRGTMGLNLMRSCTSWPAGVWIDKPTRRLPDGTVLETMHGSHVFRYSLYPHRGDYRDARVNRVAQAVNHPLIEMALPAGLGQRAESRMSFIELDDPGAQLLAMKPMGFPEAAWTTGPDGKVRQRLKKVLRVWNGSGRRLQTGIEGVHNVERANLLEEPIENIESVPAVVQLPPNGFATLIGESTVRGTRHEPAPPQALASSQSAYWLENLGEGVFGNGILAVSPALRTVRLDGEPATVAVRVVNNHRTAEVAVSLHVDSPNAVLATLSRAELRVAPGSFEEVQLHIQRNAEAPDRALLTINAHSRYPWDVSAALWVLGPNASADDPLVDMVPTPAIIGASGELRTRVTNRTQTALRGTLAWLSPQVLWDHFEPASWRQTLELDPGESVMVKAPLHAAPGSYAIPRFTCGGRVAYGAAIAVVSRSDRVFVVPEVDRVRLHAGQAAELNVVARSIDGLDERSTITVQAPPGWHVQETHRALSDESAISALNVQYRIDPAGGTDAADLIVHGPGDARARVRSTIVPIQTARPRAAEIVIDGRLDEWSLDEFTQAGNEWGGMGVAVRYDRDGLVLAFDVRDDVFSQQHSGAAMWNGDSIQFGLSTVPSTAVGYQETDYEYGAGLTPDGPMLWCWIAGTGARTGRIEQATVAITLDGPRAFYEVRLPGDVLPLPPLGAGTVLGFSYIANDNDGDGFRGAVQWTRGLSGSKDPSLFGDLRLID